MDKRPSLKLARIAPYIEAIEEARQAGWTWADLKDLLEHEGVGETDDAVRRSYKRARKRYSEGTLRVEQVPLPGDQPKTQSVSSNKSASRGGTSSDKNQTANVQSEKANTESNKTVEANAKKKTPQEEARDAGLFDKYG